MNKKSHREARKHIKSAKFALAALADLLAEQELAVKSTIADEAIKHPKKVTFKPGKPRKRK